MARWLDHRKHD
nr:hypothetical protein [Tanacetum cinerariifolium]